MFRLIGPVLVFLMFAVPGSGASGQPATADPIGAFLDTQVDFSGTVLTGGLDDAPQQWVRGLADAQTGRTITPDDSWRWASVTKQLVAVLIMQHVEDGALALDDTLADRVPDFTVPGTDAITVLDLLRHTSGLGEPTDLPTPTADGQVDALAHCAVDPIAAPAERFAYNNCDTVLLGVILERVSGQDWASLMQERIFDPAGMTSAGIMTGTIPTTIKGYASAGTPEAPVNPAVYGAAGAAYGNPQDLIRFNTALMTDQLLRTDTRERLWTGEPRFGFVALGAWSFPAQLTGCEGPVPLIERRGFIGGVQVRNIIAPEQEKSVVVFVNRADFTFGEIWTGSGFSHRLLSLALCNG